MIRVLGNAVSRYWPLFLVVWVAGLIGLGAIAPDWDDVIRDGEFRYLPDDLPSREGERLFKKAFSKDLIGSSVVIVVYRDSELTDADRAFIDDHLKPRIEQIAEEEEKEAAAVNQRKDTNAAENTAGESGGATDSSQTSSKSIIARVRTFSDKSIGHLLESRDNKASLVIVKLTTEFREYRNHETIKKIEDLVGKRGKLHAEQLIPLGLELSLSGSATVGRDMRQAAKIGASATEKWTILLVVALLILIYRAPVLALIPLLTVFLAVEVSKKVLSIGAGIDWIDLFTGIDIYVMVVLYGAGVDYCMFLMARYKEELDAGATYDEAISAAIRKVGPALAASAGTTMCGIGMMAFAQFGKFQQAGIAMSLSLFWVLCASLTFAPALLKMTGRWAFWPNIRSERISAASGWVSPTSLMAKLMEKDWFQGTWDSIGRSLLKNPGKIWLSCVAVMAPFAIFGVVNFNLLSYGLLKELPKDNPSRLGADAVERHFPAGTTGPVTVLIENRNVDFADKDDENGGFEAIRTLTERLEERKQELGIADIRSVTHPLGGEGLAKIPLFRRAAFIKQAPLHYVSREGLLKGHVTRMDVVFNNDPFSRESMDQFDRLKPVIREELPEQIKQHTKLYYIGATPSIRDLKTVTSSDQIWVDSLVLISVYLVLVVLLRRPAISAYLILSVFFSYLVTLGATFAIFWMLDPADFAGLDWKVPMFLFTILIAVGQDYNIYLITRIEEEQHEHGPVEGVTVALAKTGSIISSCGVIMAGTFSSLMAGSLLGMNQLGFALAFGVMIDTFVVRPILVPAYLILLHQGRFGAFGKLLGSQHQYLPSEIPQPMKVGSDTTKGLDT